MAQVKIKKYADGGGITINNEFYSADDVNALMETLPQERKETLSAIVAGINSGKKYSYDPNKNSISGEGINDIMQGYFGSEAAAERGQKNNGRVSRSIDATVGNKRDSMRRGLAEFALLKHINRPKATEDSTSSLEALGKGSGWFDVNKDGIYDKTFGNQTKIDHLNKYKDYFGLGREAGDKKYKVSSDNLDSLWNYYNGFGDPDYINKLISTITNKPGDLSDEQINFLNALGYSKDDNGTSTTSGTSPWSISNPELSSQSADWFAKDENGRYGITQSGVDYFKSHGLDFANNNYWFGQFWRRPLNMNEDVWNNILKDKILYQGRLYDAREVNGQIGSDVSDIIHNDAKSAEGVNFYDLIRSGDFSGANGLINYLGGNTLQYDLVDPQHFSELGNGYRWRSEEGRYTGIQKPGEDWNLISYFDPNSDSDSYGFRTPSYGWINSEGRFQAVDPEFNIANYTMTNASPTDVTLPEYVSTEEGNPLKGYVRQDFTGKEGDSIGATLFYDPKNQNNLIYKNSNSEDTYNISDLGLTKEDIYKIIKDTVLRQRFNNTLKSLVSSDIGQMWQNEMSKEEWKSIVGDEQRAAAILKKIETLKKGSKSSRQYRIMNLPTYNKKGGVLTMAYGGTTGGNSKIVSTSTIKRASDKSADELNPTTPSGAGDVLRNLGHISDQDKADFLAFIADLGSAGLAFTPFSTASAVTGAVGSTMRFRSDVTRDGFQGKDLVNYGINLLLDAATALPIIGGLAKMGKLGKGIAKTAPTLIKIASAYGMTQAIPVINKIANGEKVTMRDLSTITNVITAGVGLGKSGVLNGKTKTTTEGSADINYTVKGKAKTYKLTDEKLLKNNDIEGIKTKIKETLPSEVKNEDIVIPVESKRKISNFLKKKEVIPAEWNKQTTSREYTDLSPEEAIQGGFKNWVLGKGKYGLYNRALAGQTTMKQRVPDYSGVPSDIVSNGSLLDLSVPVPTKVVDAPINVGQIVTPNVLLSQEPVQYSYYPGYIPENDRIPSYFKIGGILKANNGLKFNFKPVTFNKPGEFKPTFDPNWKPEVKTTIGNYTYDLGNNSVTYNKPNFFGNTFDPNKPFGDFILGGKTSAPTDTTENKPEVETETNTETFGDGFARNPLKFTPSKAIDFARFANSLGKAKALKDIRTEMAVAANKVAPIPTYDGGQYYLSEAGNEYRKQGVALNGEAARLGATTSDGHAALATRLAAANLASADNAQGNIVDASENRQNLMSEQQKRQNYTYNFTYPHAKEVTTSTTNENLGSLTANGDFDTEKWRSEDAYAKAQQIRAEQREQLEDDAAYSSLMERKANERQAVLLSSVRNYMPSDYTGTAEEYLSELSESNPTLYNNLINMANRASGYNPYLTKAEILSSRNPVAGYNLKKSITTYSKQGGILDRDYARKLIKNEN